MPSFLNLRVLSRKAHRWGAIAIAVPFLVVIATGILLQLKKEWSWVQPAENRGAGTVPVVSLERVLSAAQSIPEAGIRSWADIDRVDVRPAKGIMKITSNSRWEIQVDSETGAVLQTAYRRSDWLESLHDGSWFHPQAKLWLFLPTGIIVFVLWLTGIYLWLLPLRTRRKRARLLAVEGGGPVPRRDRAASGTRNTA